MNHITLLGLIAGLLYCYTATLQSIALWRGQVLSLIRIEILASCAVLIHGVLLYFCIDVGTLQNLTFFNLLSLVIWLGTLLLLCLALIKPILNLGVLIFPASAASIGLALLFPESMLVDTGANLKELFHILTSTLAVSVLCLAMVQALLYAAQEFLLRHKPATRLGRVLPPLEIMEKILFQLIAFGFILLTIVVITSFWSFANVWLVPLLAKTLVTIISWFIFAILLFGHWYLGWRGRSAVRWTLTGFLLVVLVYFGSLVI